MREEGTSHLRHTAFYLGTIVTTQIASFALLPLITRFLGPDAYGEYALALAISGLLGILASSWIRNVAFRYYFEAREDGTSRSFFWSLAILQAIAVVVAFSLGSIILPLLGQEIVPLRTLWAAAAMVLASDFQAMTLTFVRGEQRSGRYAAAEVGAAVTRLAGTAGGLLLGLDQASFLLLAAAGASVLGGVIAYIGLRDHLLGPPTLSRRPVLAVSKHLVGAMPFSIGEWIGNLSDRLVLNAFAGTAAVGVYAAGHSLGDRLIGGLVMAVFLMAWPDILSSFTDGGYAAARRAVHRYFQLYLWLTTGPLLALIIFGETIVSLLGTSYADAVQVIGLVSAAAWLRGLSNGFNRHFELEKRFYALSAVTVLGALTNLALNLWLVPTLHAVGSGIASVSAQVLVATVYIAIRDRRLVYFPLQDLAYVICASIVLALASWWLLGGNLFGLLVFAAGYVVVMALIWGYRLRGSFLPFGRGK